MKIPFIDLSRQYKTIKNETDKIVQDTFSQGDFVLGENVEKFEKAFALFCGVKYCVGVASGTDALLLSLRVLGIGEGDEVITTPFTFIGSVLPIIYLGAKPIFIDINPATYQIDASKLEKAITKRTKAIIPVHLYGYPAPMLEIMKIGKKHNLFVVEDVAQAHGSKISEKKCGSFGDLSAFSFYPSKSLGAAGDGGAVVTDNKQLAQTIRAMRHVGQYKKYKHDLIGYNSRLDTLHAGVLLIKLKMLDSWTGERIKLAAYYNKLLTGLPIVLPPKPDDGISPNYYVYQIRTPKRDKLLEFLKNNGISCAVYYPIPLHLQTALKELGHKKGDFPIAEKYSQEVLSLPIYPELKKSEIRYICARIREFFKK